MRRGALKRTISPVSGVGRWLGVANRDEMHVYVHCRTGCDMVGTVVYNDEEQHYWYMSPQTIHIRTT